MNDRQKGLYESLKGFRQRLNKINLKISNKRKILISVKQQIVDDIYHLGDYCAIHLCLSDFNFRYAFRLIENIKIQQEVYDKISKELSILLDGKDDLLNKINKCSKALGIENV